MYQPPEPKVSFRCRHFLASLMPGDARYNGARRVPVTDIEAKLKSVETTFGVELRGHQAEALRALAKGDNVILHAPTGGGKSLVFQGASHVLPDKGVTVILYPLRSLVKDQTKRAEELNLPSVTLYGDTKVKDRPEVYDKLQSGAATMLLTTPESFDRNRKMQAVLKDRVSLLVVDEAHAYEEWADGFRPTYRNAGRVVDLVGVKQIMLCSATLTNEGFNTAKRTLRRNNWTIVQVPPIRPNLVYENLSRDSDEILSRALLGRGLQAPGIVFFTTIKELLEVAGHMKNATGKDVLTYYGTMTPKARRETQEQFMEGKEWVFATKAFGMGIDKADIRSIVHYQLPGSVLSYAQEVGRAGRDGKESLCLMTQNEHGDAAQFLLEQSVPTPQNVHRVWKELITISRRYGDEFFEVDWDEMSKRTRMWPQSIQGCVSWLFTGKMLTKKEKQKNWTITLFANSEDRALAAPRAKAVEIVEALRSEGMIEGEGSAEFKPEELEDAVGGFVQDWKKKLRDLAEKGVFEIQTPPVGKARYKFLHSEFKFAEGKEQLERARAKAVERLAGIRRLQRAHPDDRRAMIEEAISLKLDEFTDGDEVEVKGATAEVRKAEPEEDDEAVPF